MRRLIFTLFVSLALVSCTRRDPAETGVTHALRVCADPNNLPFSNSSGQGFENKIADLLAREWQVAVEYTWWAQRRGFVRNTLRAGLCDVVMGVPAGYDLALTTRPYYRSSYAFVFRRNAGFAIHSFDSPLLRKLRVGVQLIGDDGSNSPPAHALARRGIVKNVSGFRVAGDYSEPDPPARIIDAVGRGVIDVAVAWGPMAGYFARRQPVPLEVVPVLPAADNASLPFVFDISMGVRQGDRELKRRLEQVLTRRKTEIESILDSYGVPRL
jgi:mxaJ protein